MDVFEYLIQHQVDGMLWRLEHGATLVIGDTNRVLKGRVLMQGNITVRYGIPYQGPNHLSVTLPSVKTWASRWPKLPSYLPGVRRNYWDNTTPDT